MLHILIATYRTRIIVPLFLIVINFGFYYLNTHNHLASFALYERFLMLRLGEEFGILMVVRHPL